MAAVYNVSSIILFVIARRDFVEEKRKRKSPHDLYGIYCSFVVVGSG